MKINILIKRLEKLRNDKGNVNILVEDWNEDYYSPRDIDKKKLYPLKVEEWNINMAYLKNGKNL